MRVRSCSIAVLLAASLSVCAVLAWPRPAHERTIWNYDGGVELVTNGSIPDGPCFRINGRVSAPDFFDHLKRIDTETGTIFRRGAEAVTQFPDSVVLTFVVRDHYDKTCPPRVENTGSFSYLTRAIMSKLDLFLYWKRGVELRPIRDVVSKYFSVDPVIPYAVAQAHDLPERFQWSYQYIVPSKGVPLTDSLVLVLRTPNGHIVARVAARLCFSLWATQARRSPVRHATSSRRRAAGQLSPSHSSPRGGTFFGLAPQINLWRLVMAAQVPDKYKDLFKKKAFANLSTLNADGSPQVTPVWVDFDGKYVRINSARGRVKDKNIRRDPRVALSIQDPDNPYRYLEVRGKVSEITEKGADEHIDSLANKYLGVAKYPHRSPGEVRVLYKIEPQKFSAMG
jgi:PPOX class probable F420-dependent enzyme